MSRTPLSYRSIHPYARRVCPCSTGKIPNCNPHPPPPPTISFFPLNRRTQAQTENIALTSISFCINSIKAILVLLSDSCQLLKAIRFSLRAVAHKTKNQNFWENLTAQVVPVYSQTDVDCRTKKRNFRLESKEIVIVNKVDLNP